MKAIPAAQPGTLTIPLNPDEPRAEYLLRCAAAFISAYATDQPVIYDDECDTLALGDGTDLARDLLSAAEELSENRERTARSMTFIGKLIQAGNDDENQPSVTIHTTIASLQQCEAMPFYQAAEITITPYKK